MSGFSEWSSILLSVAILVLLIGRLRVKKSKDQVADYIQECINAPDKDVYYRDGRIVIGHHPHSSTPKAKEEVNA